MNARELLLGGWSWSPAPVLGVAALAGWYWVAHRRRAGRARIACFGCGLAVLLLALVSPLATLARGYLFSAHMLQHLLLLLVAPALLLAGLPERANARAASRHAGRSRWLPSPRSRAVAYWCGGVSGMWLWHIPSLCSSAALSPAVYAVETLSLVALGTAFWRPVYAPAATDRLPPLAGVVYLFSACVACTVLGIGITFAPVGVCPAFVQPRDVLGVLPLLREGWGLDPARDQQLGGLIMWVPACLVYLSGMLSTLARWYRQPSPEPAPATPAAWSEI